MAVALAQPAVANVASSATSSAAVYGVANTLGNVLVAEISISGTGTDILASISDTQGNTWVKIVNKVSADGDADVEIWYVASCKAGANTVTAHSTASSNRLGLAIYELSGAASTPDQSNVAEGTDASVAGAAITPSKNGAFVLGGYTCSASSSAGDNPTVTASFTEDYVSNRTAAAHEIQATAASVRAFTSSGSHVGTFETAIVSFVAGGAPGPGGSHPFTANTGTHYAPRIVTPHEAHSVSERIRTSIVTKPS